VAIADNTDKLVGGIGHNQPPTDTDLQNHSDDVPLWGAEAIGRAIGLGPKRAWKLLAAGLLPAHKINSSYVSTKRRLLARVLGEDGFVPPPKNEPALPKRVPRSRKVKLKPPRRKATGQKSPAGRRTNLE
jgi:hypothetical protein